MGSRSCKLAAMTIPVKQILLAACLCLTSLPFVRAGEFRVGVASRTVTPDPLLPVSGGVGPSRPASRKQGDLEVRALVLADGETRVAIVSADFLGFPSLL